MKNKIFIILLGLVLTLTACTYDGLNKEKCYQSVADSFPNTIILTTEKSGSTVKFFVIDTINNKYWIVRIGNTYNTNITGIEKLYPQN